MTSLTEKQLAALPCIRGWLVFVAAMVFAMVIVGGATRLTDSGLSITEWKPLLGAIPPLSEAHWLEALEKYRQIPEYQLINKGMSLDEFKFIYWWEWGHRFLGRAIGVVFFIPFVFFWLTGRLHKSQVPRLLVLFVLGGLQGALGWYMVKSGLVERTDVSQYRLSAHLTLATVIFAAIVWTALGIGRDKRRVATDVNLGWSALALTGLIIAQTALGGFVAGLDAGLSHNTWPLMDGRLVPNGLMAMDPAWRNFFENVLTVQFQHRVMAYVIAGLALAHAARAMGEQNRPAVRMSGLAILLTVLAQIGFGIWTLLALVPITLGLIHQGGALVVLTACIWHLHEVCAAPRTTASSAAQAT
ncbi:COX15/CtaA family protein [Anderseniella sp. Alg231-50]|uniref:COX15/CtaA family protein n=1 Tax=Anderseniella sp. Alg231-50 TaxID=1922226 RepID=UPI000D551451